MGAHIGNDNANQKACGSANGKITYANVAMLNQLAAGGSPPGGDTPPGGDGNDGACEHSECAEGVKLAPECSPCAQAVCNQDDYCCGTEWDNVCTELAAETEICNCG